MDPKYTGIYHLSDEGGGDAVEGNLVEYSAPYILHCSDVTLYIWHMLSLGHNI